MSAAAAVLPLYAHASFYDGSTPNRKLVQCPDCREQADALFGDHAGECVEFVPVAVPGSALYVVRRLALERADFTVDDLAAAFHAQGVRAHSARAALVAAERRQWVVRSTTGLHSWIVGQRLEETSR